MPSDISRRTFIKDRHYAGVQAQQGRVLSDADLNEQLEIAEHRTWTEAIDVIGACGVPKGLDAFRIGTTPDGMDLTVSPGRIYVDGLLCELDAEKLPLTFPSGVTTSEAAVGQLFANSRPLEAGQWVEISAGGKTPKIVRIIDLDAPTKTLTFSDSIADFQASTDAVMRLVATYATQPDYPDPDFSAPSLSPPGFTSIDLDDGTYLVYMIAFQREVNYIDDPHIRETALGGPDTATRLQTVFQVRLLKVTPPGAGPACDSSFPEWNNLIARPSGKLNAQSQAPLGASTPCEIPPSAGFRSLENQLYRVEIQQAGTLPAGVQPAPTFKWSRENASIETHITVNGNTIIADDLGRDTVLGFAGGQWIEITDDETALNLTAHDLVQINEIKPATREITTIGTISGFSGKSRLKMRRWDQSGASATASGVAAQRGVWLDLEDGVQVFFGDGSYQTGDYWLIPARTGTGEIEWPPFQVPNSHPIPQPPAGICRHYCKLALITSAGGVLNIVDDCRDQFPPLTDIEASDVGYDGSCLGLASAKTVQEALDILCENSEIASPFVSNVFKIGAYGATSAIRNGDTLLSTELSRGLLVQLTGNINPVNATPAACFVALDLPFTFSNQIVGFQPVELAASVFANAPSSISWTPIPNTRRYLSGQVTLDGDVTFAKDWDTGGVTGQWRYAGGTAQAVYLSQNAPPLALNNSLIRDAANSVQVSVDLPGGFVGDDVFSVGVIFNFLNANDYWVFTFQSGSVPSGTGSFSDVSGIGLSHFVNGRVRESTQVSLPGANAPTKVDLSIIKPPSGPLTFSVKYSGVSGQAYPRDGKLTFASAPTAFTKGSQVGLLSRWRSGARFTAMSVTYTTAPEVLLPPRILSRMTVKRDFLLSNGATATHPDYSLWFNLLPSQAYGYATTSTFGIGLNLL